MCHYASDKRRLADGKHMDPLGELRALTKPIAGFKG